MPKKSIQKADATAPAQADPTATAGNPAPVGLPAAVGVPAPVGVSLDIAPNVPDVASPVMPEAPALSEIEGIDYRAIAERVATSAVKFYSTMLEGDSVELFLQCREFVRIATEETDAPIDVDNVRAGMTSLTDFVRLGAARDGSDDFTDGNTFREELGKCIKATAAWEDGFPGAKVDDKLAVYRMKMKKEAEAKEAKAKAAAKRKLETMKRNEKNWKKQNKPVLLKECEKRGIDTKGKKVADLKKLLFDDDERKQEEEKVTAKSDAIKGLNGSAESKDNDRMDVDKMGEGDDLLDGDKLIDVYDPMNVEDDEDDNDKYL